MSNLTEQARTYLLAMGYKTYTPHDLAKAMECTLPEANGYLYRILRNGEIEKVDSIKTKGKSIPVYRNVEIKINKKSIKKPTSPWYDIWPWFYIDPMIPGTSRIYRKSME